MDVDPDWWKSIFDEIYLITDARTVCDDEVTRREIDFFCDLVPMNSCDHILDLCGGHGRHCLELCRRGFFNCTVFDYSDTLLKIGAQNAKKNNYPVRFVRGDARNMELDDNQFDHVMILGNSLGYLTDDDSDLRILSESRRVLKPNGWLLLDVSDGQAVRNGFLPNSWHEIEDDVVVCRQRELDGDFLCAREMVLSKKKGFIRDKTYCIRLYEQSRLEDLLTDAGFTDMKFFSGNGRSNRDMDLGFMNHRLIVSARHP